MKERIGDALRNAGMRFGAALELWHKGDLHIDEGEPGLDENAGKERATQQQHGQKPEEGPEPDATILAQMNAAKTVADLTKVMNALPQGEKRLYTGHFNQRMNELKKAA
jgi:hypothetical protein